MKLTTIIISLPEFFEGEASAITRMLDSEAAARVHLRKPGCMESDMRVLIESIPASLHHRLSLHDCHDLASSYGCGAHINRRNPEVPAGFSGSISRSCHSVKELALYPQENYLFLSPIFPSISKPGYMPPFTIESLKGKVDGRTVALGGVSPDKYTQLAETGFGGAAMLGYVWDAVKDGRINELINTIKCFNT